MKSIFSLLALVLSSSAFANTTIRCEAPTGASTGMELTVSTDGKVAVTTPSGDTWLAMARNDGVGFILATLVSMRPMAPGSTQFTWERLEYQIDRRVPTQADVYVSRLENRTSTPLNMRLMATFARPAVSRVNCSVQ